jgi:hypothetical protein
MLDTHPLPPPYGSKVAGKGAEDPRDAGLGEGEADGPGGDSVEEGLSKSIKIKAEWGDD